MRAPSSRPWRGCGSVTSPADPAAGEDLAQPGLPLRRRSGGPRLVGDREPDHRPADAGWRTSVIRDENPYGWGVDNIPMFRQLPARGTSPLAVATPFRGVAGNLAQDVHWPQTIFCVVLTCLILAGLYFFGYHPSPPPVKPEPPVEVAFQLPEEVPVVPPPVVAAPPPLVVRQAPPPPPPKVLKKPPPPPPKKVAVRPPPPEPTPIVAPAPVETPLPPPSRMLPPTPKRRVVEAQVLPPQKQALVAKAEPDLLPAPSRATYKATPAPAAVALPERKSAFTAANPGVEPGAPSTRPRLADRAPARQALPRETVAVPGSAAAPDLSNVAPGISGRHYAAPRSGPALPAESRRGTTVSAAGEVADLGAPSAPARPAGSGERETATQLPAGPRNVSGFAAGSTEVALNVTDLNRPAGSRPAGRRRIWPHRRHRRQLRLPRQRGRPRLVGPGQFQPAAHLSRPDRRDHPQEPAGGDAQPAQPLSLRRGGVRHPQPGVGLFDPPRHLQLRTETIQGPLRRPEPGGRGL